MEIPISSNQSFVNCSQEYDKFYQVREMLTYLTPDHIQDVMGMRTICPISQLQSFRQLRILHHPYLFNSFQK